MSASALAAQSGARLDSLFVVNDAGQPVSYATVALNGGTARVTDANGLLVFKNLNSETPNMLVRRMGYEPFQGKLTRASSNVAFRVTLPSSAQTLKKVAVVAKGYRSPLELTGFYERMLEVQRGAYTAEFFTPEQVESRVTAKASNILTASRFLRVGYTTESRARAVLMGNRTECGMALLLDGNQVQDVLKYKDPAMNGRYRLNTSIDEILNGEEVMAIEVYPSIANAPISISSKVMGSNCGPRRRLDRLPPITPPTC